MPTYEYECEECGYCFEAYQSITDEPIHDCPKCGVDKSKRMITGGSGFILKGSGFYCNDYPSAEKKLQQAGCTTEKASEPITPVKK